MFLNIIKHAGVLTNKNLSGNNDFCTLKFNYNLNDISTSLDRSFREMWSIKEEIFNCLNEHHLKIDIYIISCDYSCDYGILLYLNKDVLRKISYFSSNLFFNFSKPNAELHKNTTHSTETSQNRTKVTIDLGINSTEDRFKPDECSLKTGILPDEIRYKGEVNSAGHRISFSEWGIQNKSRSQNFDIAVDETINRIESNVEKLTNYAAGNKFDIMLNAYIVLENDAPDFFVLSKKSINRIVKLNCDIGFDLYDHR